MRYQIGASITFGLALILSAPIAGHAQSAGSEQTEGRPALTLPFDGRGSESETGENQEFVFRLYDQETGGTLLFEERQTAHLTNGSYTVLIGAATPGGIPAPILQSDSTLWIEASEAGASLDHTPRVLASTGANTKEQSRESSQSAKSSETVPDPMDQVPRLANFHLRNVATDLCLDTNDDKAFPQICQPSSNSQAWSEWYRMPYRGRTMKMHLKNFETQHCLESNRAGQVSANPCELNNNSQTWVTRPVTGYGAVVTFQNFATGSCLAVNRHGDLVTGECNSPDLHPLWAREPAIRAEAAVNQSSDNNFDPPGVAGSAMASTIPSVEPYLVHYLPGPSCGSNSYRVIGRNFYANPESWNSWWQFSSEHSDDAGLVVYITETYYENGVTAYDEFEQCRNHQITYIQSPTSYVHRHRTQHWACGTVGAGCQILGTTTTKWSGGTTFE